MIVRRIAAGTAAAALLGTVFVAGPAAAKSKGQGDLTLDKGLVNSLGAASVGVSAVKPAKLSQQGVVTLPVKNVKGKVITHKGGISFTPTGKDPLTLINFVINYKTGKVSATATAPLPDPLALDNVMVLSGGKNKIAKNGTWKNATLKLAKSFTFLDKATDPATLIGPILGVEMPTGQKIGKLTITVKQ